MRKLLQKVRSLVDGDRERGNRLHLAIFLVVLLAALVIYLPAESDRGLLIWLLLGLINLAYLGLLVVPKS